MIFRNMKYYLKSAASSFFRNGIMTFASFITVTCCLFLFGICLLFLVNVNGISSQIEAQCEIRAYLNSAASDEMLRNSYNEILNIENVSNAQMETKEEAFDNYKKMLGEKSSVLEGLEGKDFLRSSVRVTLKDIRKSADVVEKLKTVSGVEEVVNRQDIVRKVVNFTNVLKHASALVMLVLLVIAAFIIQNTIKLSVFAREKEIHIMKFVGATNHFIRTPFVIEGIIIGLLGFAVSYTVIVLTYNAGVAAVENTIGMFNMLPLEKCAVRIGLLMAAFGVLMGAVGSGVSVKKHLKV